MDSKETVIAYRELYANDIKTLENAFYNIFPNAKIEFSIRSSVGSPILRINILLISDTKDQSSGCNDNDPLGIKFIGFLPEISSPNKATKFDLEKLSGGLSCNPEKGSYMAMNTLKLPFKKVREIWQTKVKNW